MKVVFGLTLLALLSASCKTDTKKIEYGSNGGKYITINDRKIYFEEYGQGTPLILLSGGGLSHSIKDFEKCIPVLSKITGSLRPIHRGRAGQNRPIP